MLTLLFRWFNPLFALPTSSPRFFCLLNIRSNPSAPFWLSQAAIICSGLFAFLQTLEFPGAYSATGLLGGGPSGAAWLFNFWRITFALAVIAYALLKDANDTASQFIKNEPSRAIAITIACALAVTAGLTWLGTAGG